MVDFQEELRDHFNDSTWGKVLIGERTSSGSAKKACLESQEEILPCCIPKIPKMLA